MKFYVTVDPEGIARQRATKDYEQQIRLSYRMAGGESCWRQPISVKIQAVFRIPKSASKEKRREMAEGDMLPAKRPDVDSIMEVVCNALRGIAYHNDAQIVHCEASKSYGLISGLFVEIVPMGEEMP